MSRKALTKRKRFEIFKRDSFTCQYCGAHPPAVILEVDHIEPVALGGTNDDDNLITSCFDCNRGKSDVSLDVHPQTLAEKAELLAEREAQIIGYQEIAKAARDRIDRDIWEIVDAFWGTDSCRTSDYMSIKRFIERIGLLEVLDAVDVTLQKFPRKSSKQFSYFCGVCWNKVRNGGGL